MKVKELIEHLSKFNPELDVEALDEERTHDYDIIDVGEISDDSEVPEAVVLFINRR